MSEAQYTVQKYMSLGLSLCSTRFADSKWLLERSVERYKRLDGYRQSLEVLELAIEEEKKLMAQYEAELQNILEAIILLGGRI